MDMRLEVVVLPVSDLDRAKDFYVRLGWRLDASGSHHPAPWPLTQVFGFRVVARDTLDLGDDACADRSAQPSSSPTGE